ncbi:gluconate 2-dehydrogenase subunit 3 family protein [Aestuariivivens sediminis]|uniref:gluconate 2-dehydrogenase subunit 3 family protein n=1 Tax=Aestuariivivens sediminis TaxID=2913557 RepID=UPI001F571EF8|nr:gluconate 2-dehydrogenase subunit 3 family protein [Aestuariivivens sediminis]
MKRRDSIKSILLGSVAGGLALKGCTPANPDIPPANLEWPEYGRTTREKERDNKLFEDTFFNTHELMTIGVLCDIILPANNLYKSATEAGVLEFIEFVAKDMEQHKLPIRGGVMWLDYFSNSLFKKVFISCTLDEQLQICDQIAYPQDKNSKLQAGISFFSRMRDLVITGYYTSKIGIEELGYKGNVPNVWDGVPEHVLKKHGLEYDDGWLAKCVDQSKQGVIAEWDDQGNLIT